MAGSTPSSPMTYSPSLDGLRAVAILGVLIFHVFPSRLHGGFTGVDVFFVLSGYLIASVILLEVRAGSFRLGEFYLRRVQRLVPNAALMVLFTVALSWAVLLPSEPVIVASHGLWAIFNLSNFYILNNLGGYWSDTSAAAPLLHTWSLAIEEQFYLLFPVTLLFFSRRTHLFRIVAGLCTASFAFGIWSTDGFPNASFYMLPMRAWEPLLGAALAAFLLPADGAVPPRNLKPSLLTGITGWTGLTMTVAGFFFIRDGQHFPGAWALIPTLGALAVIISVTSGGAGPARLLSQPPVVVLGKMSYSLYLWHWPVIVIGAGLAQLLGLPRQQGTRMGALAGTLLAVLAYRFVEQPLRQRGPGRQRRILVLAAGFALVAAACFLVSLRHPVADPLGLFDRPQVFGRLYTLGPVPQRTSARVTGPNYDVFRPRVPLLPPDVLERGGIVHNWGNGTPQVVVLGSSHATMYGRLIDDICRAGGISVAFLAEDAVPVFFSSGKRPLDKAAEPDFDSARRRWVREWKPAAALVIDRWDQRFHAAEPQVFEENIRNLLGELSPYSGRVIIFSQAPALRFSATENLREYVTWSLRVTGKRPRLLPDDAEVLRLASISAIQAVARDYPNVELLRVDRNFYQEDGTVRYSSGRDFFYNDYNHLTQAGAEVARDLVTHAIVAATARP